MVLGREQERWAAEVASAAARTKRLGLVQQQVALCSQAAASSASLEEVMLPRRALHLLCPADNVLSAWCLARRKPASCRVAWCRMGWFAWVTWHTAHLKPEEVSKVPEPKMAAPCMGAHADCMTASEL